MSGTRSDFANLVTAFDYGFREIPEAAEDGSRFTLANDSPSEVHEFAAIRLPENEKRSVAALAQLPDRDLDLLVRDISPATILVALPQGTGSAVVGDGRITQEGRYLILCRVPMAADPEAYLAAAAASSGVLSSVPGGAPHFTRGMYAEMVVN